MILSITCSSARMSSRCTHAHIVVNAIIIQKPFFGGFKVTVASHYPPAHGTLHCLLIQTNPFSLKTWSLVLQSLLRSLRMDLHRVYHFSNMCFSPSINLWEHKTVKRRGREGQELLTANLFQRDSQALAADTKLQERFNKNILSVIIIVPLSPLGHFSNSPPPCVSLFEHVL